MVVTADVLSGVTTDVRRLMEDCRAVVGPELRRSVRRLPGPLWRVAGYHFGWLDVNGRPVVSGAGKMIRPALVLLSARVVGAGSRDVLPAAVAVELVHNFSLLHDDVMDDDRLRHHRATAWAVFGIPAAVLVGDALWALALRVLGDCGHPAADDGVRELSVALSDLMSGQSADMDFERRGDVALNECLTMVAGKTGALLGAACALGALFGGGSVEQVECLRRFGRCVGMAFQFVDDVLGIWGDPAATGKPVWSDLASRKKSLPVVYALSSRTAAGRELAELYQGDRQLTPDELERAATLVGATGGREWAQREAELRVSEALACLHAAGPDPRAAADLAAVAGHITRRDR
jgi:geranylgeranyl diphosphate synthase, type I